MTYMREDFCFGLERMLAKNSILLERIVYSENAIYNVLSSRLKSRLDRQLWADINIVVWENVVVDSGAVNYLDV
jgi:hypothetical protein